MKLSEKLEESAAFLKGRIRVMPDVAIVLGSGLGHFAEKLDNVQYIPYEEVPHLCSSTAPDHEGRFAIGWLLAKPVICMQGRLHGYEGYTPQQIAYPIYLLKKLGVRALVLTNAAGGINTEFQVGDLMLIEDHINFTGKSPLTGENDSAVGTRFPDMTFAYTPGLRQLALRVADEVSEPVKSGVYVGFYGPQFETPAEIRAFRTLGGDAVGMSTVFEAIAAAHCGLPVLGISMITNMAAGVLMQPITGEEVNEIARRRSPAFEQYITALLRAM